MIKIPILAVPNIDHCNFRCVGCNAASPYMGAKFHEASAYSEHLKTLSEYLRVDRLTVAGGEPFLDVNLLKFIRELGWQKIADRVEVVTNGFWLTKGSSLLPELMAIPGVIVSISTHPENLIKENIVDRRNNVCYLLDKYGKDRIFIRLYDNFFIPSFSEEYVKSAGCGHMSCCSITLDGRVCRCNNTLHAGSFPNTTAQFIRAAEKSHYKISDGCEAGFVDWYSSDVSACHFCSGMTFKTPHISKRNIATMLETGASCL
jgi:hypothetical protein